MTTCLLIVALAILFLPMALVIRDPHFNPWPALSDKQRKWILRRDEGKCQFPVWNDATFGHFKCGSTECLHIHHIFPKRAFLAWLRFLSDPHDPKWLVSICKFHHWKIHPDMVGKKSKEDWECTSERRDALIMKGEPYWNTKFDTRLIRIAQTRTEKYMHNHPDDPYPQTRKKSVKK